MSATRLIAIFSVGVACCGSAQAAATAEGAKAIADGYAAYVSQKAIDDGVVSVAPRGDDYLVTWNLQKVIDQDPASDDKINIEPFSYILSEGAGGAWTISAEKFPALDLDVASGAGRVTGKIEFLGFGATGAYDANAPETWKSSAHADSIAMKFRFTDPAPGGDETFSVNAPSLELRAHSTGAGAGVDVAATYQNTSITGVITVPTPGDDAVPMAVNVGFGISSGAYAIDGLRATELGDFWRFIVARAGATPSTPPTSDELRDHLRAALPIWRQFRADLTDHDFTMISPMFSLSAKSFGQSIALGGLTPEGGLQFSVTVADLTLASPLAPAWFASIVPASFQVDAKVALQGLDKIAELVLDDPTFGTGGELSQDTQVKVTQSLLAGHPKLSLAPGRFKTPMIDVAFKGDISVDPTAPGASVVISADGLDKTTALLQEVSATLPSAQQALLGVAFAKGLAKTDSDGRLVWAIEVNGNDVTVNGTPMPKSDP